MTLSFNSWFCIALAVLIFLFDVFLSEGSIYDVTHMKEMYDIRPRSWNTWEGFMGNLQTGPYPTLIYIVVTALLSLLTIVGVVKRNVYLMLPLCLVIPIGLFYRENWYYLRPNWTVRYAAVFSFLFVLYFPLIAVWREIRQEKIAKRRQQERI